MLTPSDSDGNAMFPPDESQERELSVRQVAVPAPSAPVDDLPERVTGALGGRNGRRENHPYVEPRSREMDGIDLSTYVLSSRYVTLNFVMILLASAVLVAAIAFGFLIVGSHANPGFVVTLTSAGTVAVTGAARAAKKRRQARQKLRRDSGLAGDVPAKSQPE